MRANGSSTLLVIALSGCACSTTRSLESASTSTTPTSTETADYEVHEWGLLRSETHGDADVLRAGAVAPPRPVEVMAVDKPVLYFHASSPLTLRRVSASVDGGAILESWPFVPTQLRHEGAEIAWRDVSLGSPTNCVPSALPTAAAPPCSLLGPGAFCESAGLAVVRTDEAACVSTGEVTDRFLFYRAQSHSFVPPLRFVREHVYEDVRVTNDGDHPIPGVIVRIWSDGARTRTLIAEPPAPHASVVIGHAFDAAVDEDQSDRPFDRRGTTDESMPAPSVEGPGREGIRRSMREIGLTDAEVDAFLRAWDATLFGSTNVLAIDDSRSIAATDGTPVDMPVDRLSVDGELAPRESLLYFLPEQSTDRIARLSFDPPPRAVHRAMAIWTAIRPSGEGR